MAGVIFYGTVAVLMVLLGQCGVELVAAVPLGRRPVPWAAAGLTTLAILAIATQLLWPPAMATFDADPSRTGWWRVLTSVFLQNGGVAGALYNLVTLVAISALAEWFWGAPLTLLLFLAGAVLPAHLDGLLGATGGSTDPRNSAGSSGATFFLGATMAAALLLQTRHRRERIRALAVPSLGLLMWWAQANGHGLVSAEGFVLGLVCWAAVGRRHNTPSQHLHPLTRMQHHI